MLPTQIQYWANVEAQRHNLVSEKQNAVSIREQKRHNKKTEKQTDYSNKTSRYDAKTRRMGQKEAKRHNLATEDISNRDLGERVRHNLVQESQGWSSIANDRIRANAAVTSAAASMKSAEAAKTNAAVNRTKMSSEVNNIQSQTRLNRARKRNTDVDTGVKISGEVRQWTNTATNVLGAIKGLK